MPPSYLSDSHKIEIEANGGVIPNGLFYKGYAFTYKAVDAKTKLPSRNDFINWNIETFLNSENKIPQKVSQEGEIIHQIMAHTVMVMHFTTILDLDGLLHEGHRLDDPLKPPLIHMEPVDQGKVVYFAKHY